MHKKLILYSSPESQWAMVPHLGLIEKGFSKDQYEVKSLGLVAADNFHPDYIKINPNGTVPSLIDAHLDAPLTDSREILKRLDELHPDTNPLGAENATQQAKVDGIIELVHDDNLSTNLILLQARSKEEMEAKRASMWKEFVCNRQSKLEQHQDESPEHPFYPSKLKDNTPLHQIYTKDSVEGSEFDDFFKQSYDGYREFAGGLDRLNSAIVLPFVAGDKLTYADLHVVPWLSHAMWGAGATEIHDFAPLEEFIGKSVPGFKVGDRVKEWWTNISKRDSFKEVYPNLH